MESDQNEIKINPTAVIPIAAAPRLPASAIACVLPCVVAIATTGTMPQIRGLEKFLSSHELIQTIPLSSLRGTVIGADGVMWCKNFGLVSEPLQVATGGSALAVKASVSRVVSQFTAAGIKPIIVFGGLMPGFTAATHPGGDKTSVDRHSGWLQYEGGQTRSAAFTFSKLPPVVTLEVQTQVYRALSSAGTAASVMRAPYNALSQLAWLSYAPQSFVHAVYGGLELLLYRVERVVLSIDFKTNTCSYVDLSQVLDELSLSHGQFLDVCLLAGWGKGKSGCRSFDKCVDSESGQFSFARAYELVQEHGSGRAVIESFAQDPNAHAASYYASFIRTRHSVVLDHYVMSAGATVAPLHAFVESKAAAATATTTTGSSGTTTTPVSVSTANVFDTKADLSKDFGPLFPKAVYTLVAKNVVSPQVFNNVLSGALVDAEPAVNSQEYEALIHQLTPIRTRTFAVLSNALSTHAPALKHAKIVNRRWYDPALSVVLHPPAASAGTVPPLVIPNNETGIHLIHSVVRKSFEAHFANVPLVAGPGADASSKDQKTTAAATASSSGAVTKSPLLAMIINEPAFFAIYLLRTGVLNGKRSACLTPQRTVFFAGRNTASSTDSSASGAASGAASATVLSTIPEQRLLARVFSLLPLTIRGDCAWAGPIDRDLAAFTCQTKALQKSCRHLTEAIVTSILVSNSELANSLTGTDYSVLAESLPFGREPSALMGLVALHWLSGKSVDDLIVQFPQAAAVQNDLEQCIELWLRVMTAVVYIRNVEKPKKTATAIATPVTTTADADAKSAPATAAAAAVTMSQLNAEFEPAEVEEFIAAHRWLQAFMAAHPFAVAAATPTKK